MTRDQNQSSSGWIGSAIVTAVLGVATWWTYQAGQGGIGEAAVASIPLALFTAVSGLRTLQAWDQSLEERWMRRRSRKRSKSHGDSKFGTLKHAKKSDLIRDPYGFYVGEISGRPFVHAGEGCTLTMCPPGGGKTVGNVSHTLLRLNHSQRRRLFSCLRSRRKRATSYVIHDPKLEVYAVCAEHLRSIGYQVICWCPHHEKMSSELGIDIPFHPCNPLTIINPNSPSVKDECELVASLLCPVVPNSTETDKFWARCGQELMMTFMLDLIRRGHQLTLPTLRTEILASGEDFGARLDDMIKSDAYGGLLRECAHRICNRLMNSDREHQAVLSTAAASVALFDSFGPVGRHVSEGEIPDLKNPEKPVALFIGAPGEFVETLRPWTNLMLSTLIEHVGRDRTVHPVRFLFDEFATLHIPNILRAIGMYRSTGFVPHFFVQQVDQLARINGEGWREFIGLSEIINAYNVRDPRTLQMLSELTGQRTARDVSFGSGGQAHASNHAQPLLRPEDIRSMPDDLQLVLHRNDPPYVINKRSYLKVRRLRWRAKPNPYHRKGRRCSSENPNGYETSRIEDEKNPSILGRIDGDRFEHYGDG